MRRLIVLLGFVSLMAASSFVPARATYSSVLVTSTYEVHAAGQSQGGELPRFSTSCGNVPRAKVCDAIVSETPQTVSAGSEKRGASVTVVSEEGTLYPGP